MTQSALSPVASYLLVLFWVPWLEALLLRRAVGVGYSCASTVSSLNSLCKESNGRCSVPAGAFAWVLLFVAMPANFPNAPSAQAETSAYNGAGQKIKAVFRRVDMVGALILLVACSFAIAALQEGNYEYPWSSGLVISFLVISGLFWILFLLWEWFIHKRNLDIYAMFPWRLTHNRVFLGSVLLVTIWFWLWLLSEH
jgi:hypothetical protein